MLSLSLFHNSFMRESMRGQSPSIARKYSYTHTKKHTYTHRCSSIYKISQENNHFPYLTHTYKKKKKLYQKKEQNLSKHKVSCFLECCIKLHSLCSNILHGSQPDRTFGTLKTHLGAIEVYSCPF